MEKVDISHDVVKFYPSYIDADCKVYEGRKLKKELCVAGVNTKEIYDVLNDILKFKCIPEYVSFLIILLFFTYYRNIIQMIG